MKSLAPQVGLEPTTLRLTAECSTVELLRTKVYEFLPFNQTDGTAVKLPSRQVSRQSENVLIGQSRNVLLTWWTLGGWKPKDRY